jgi:hypothetical protein
MTKTPDTNLQYRTPTVKDRHRLPIQCVVRTTPKNEWKPALLVDIFAHASHNFAVVPSDAPPAGVKAGKIKVEMYRECLIRDKAPTPAESIVDPPPVPQGTSPEIPKASGELAMLIALDAKEKLSSPPKPSPKFKLGERVVCGPPEDVVYIRAIHTFDEVHGWKYAIDRYSVTDSSRLIDQVDHIPEDIIKPYIPSVPFPNGTWVKVIDGKYKDHVGVVINDAVSRHTCQVKVNSNLNIMVLTQHLEELPANHVPDNAPPPKFGMGDPVYYDSSGVAFYVQSSIRTSWGWRYKIINMNPDGTIWGQLTAIPEAELTPAENKVNVLDLPPTPQENNTVVNEQGGRQSHLDARFDCIPPVVLRLLAQCLGFGARKYGKDNWKNIPQWDHLNHAMNHINEWNRGNRDEPHLVNAIARLTFALWQAVDTNQQPDTYQHPDQLK